MKKSLLLFVACLSVLLIFTNAQTDKKDDGKNSGKFFKTYEDFLAGKPVEGIDIKMTRFGDKFEITQNGETKVLKIKKDKLPYNLFYNPSMYDVGDHTEHLMRYFNDRIYYVIIAGPISLYIMTAEAHWQSYDGGSFVSANGIHYYYSETMNNDIQKFTPEIFESYLKKYDLKEKYDAEKKEIKKAKKDVLSLFYTNDLKYINLLNEKMK